ncbi:hypothetical protein RZS08_26890, partial [Arthrospira platensis SPKY1]|nr:hypothetical protein [Arthrospira platensis SPKY1]
MLGAVQQNYPVLYSFAGGNVSISAGLNIERFTRNTLGELIPDSSRQLPNNWLYRRSFVDADGNFGAITIQQQLARFNDPAASTTWWVDFSNFFQSFGTLGGGHLQLVAGRDVRNVDAVVPTNARMPAGRPDAARLVEMGG